MFKTIGKAVATVALAAGLATALGSPALASITASDCLRANNFITEHNGVDMCHGAGQSPADGEVIIG